MIPQELIDRLKKCCEWLASREGEMHFCFDGTLFFTADALFIGFYLTKLKIEPDPLCEYPNALHRIVKDVCNETMDVFETIDNDWMCVLGKNEIPISSKFPLHAEIEATCIAIEGLMEVKDGDK
jgi:hypothetical protein